MTESKYFVKKHGRLIINEIFLITIFSIVFLVVNLLLLSLWFDEEETYLSKTGTFTSITGVFLGTFIAIWLINQNRTKNIEENFFFKLEFLINLHGILGAVFGICFNIKADNHLGNKDVEKITEVRDISINEFNYWKEQIQ